MYIIAIAWLYVTVLMAATEKTITAGILTFTFYGLIPCALLLWLFGIKHRHYKRSLAKKKKDELLLEQVVEKHHSQHTQDDQ